MLLRASIPYLPIDPGTYLSYHGMFLGKVCDSLTQTSTVTGSQVYHIDYLTLVLGNYTHA